MEACANRMHTPIIHSSQEMGQSCFALCLIDLMSYGLS